jgi:hypothetical protein
MQASAVEAQYLRIFSLIGRLVYRCWRLHSILFNLFAARRINILESFLKESFSVDDNSSPLVRVQISWGF